MANLTIQHPWVDGDQVTAAALNAAVQEAVPTKTFVTGRDAVPSISAADQADHYLPLAPSAESETALKKATILALVPVDDATIERNTEGKLRVKPTGLVNMASLQTTGGIISGSTLHAVTNITADGFIEAKDNIHCVGSIDADANLSAGVDVTAVGNVSGTTLIGAALRVTQQPAPLPTDDGTPGDVRFTAGYIYYCVAIGDWRRAALSTWTP